MRWSVNSFVVLLGLAAMVLSTPACAASGSTPSHVYAAIGASDVVGVGADNPDEDNWAALVARELPAHSKSRAFARSGLRLKDALAREIPEAARFKPTLVTMWLTVNDYASGVSLPTYRRQLEEALSILTRQTEAQIFVLNMPDLGQLSVGSRAQAGASRAWNDAINEVSRKFDGRVHVIDLFAPSKGLREHREWLGKDLFHPSTRGYERLAEIVVEALRERGALR